MVDPELAIRVEQDPDDGRIVTMTIDRPDARNAINLPMLQRLEAELDRLAEAPPLVLIFTAAPPAFCAGIDLKESREATGEYVHERSSAMHRVLRRLRRFPAPVIAAIDGVAAGLGCELAISGDLRIATPAARFSYPEPRVAVPSPAHHLVQLIGLSRAQDMLFTARWIDAEEAEEIGLVTLLADDAQAAAREMAEHLLTLSPFSLRVTKENIYVGIGEGATEASRHHIAGVTAAADTADRREALAAFAEKRQPRFTGR
jgi:enoyl-CoA hydratase/carnithine racemase